jgi:hypothetical protein
MKTYAYLLDDEKKPPTMYEVLGRHETGLVTLKDLDHPHIRILEEASVIWEVCSF